MIEEIEKKQEPITTINKTYETYFKIGLIGLWIAMIGLWIADSITNSSNQIILQAGAGVAIATFLFCVYYKKYLKYYKRGLLILLVLQILVLVISFLKWKFNWNIPSYIWDPISAILYFFNFLIVSLFAYIVYWCYKAAVKDIKMPKDERHKYNYNRAARNAYIFLIVAYLFIPIGTIIHWIFPVISDYSALMIVFGISIPIGIFSFYYYEKLGK